MYSPWAYALAQVHMNFTSFFMLAFCSTHKEFCNVLFLLIIFLIQICILILQVTVEIPYLLIQALAYVIISYPMIGYYGSAYKVFWNFYVMFCTMMFYNYLGMLLVSLTPNFMIASILSTVFYTLFNLFSGFLITGPVSHYIYAYL